MEISLKTLKIKLHYIPIDEMLVYINILLYVIFPIVGINIVKIFTIICSVFLILYKRKVCFSSYFWGYMAYVIFCMFSITWSPQQGIAISRLTDMFVCALFIINIQTATNKYIETEKEKYIEKVFTFYSICVCALTIYLWIMDITTIFLWARLGYRFYVENGSNQTYYTCYLICALYISIWKIINSSQKRIFWLFVSIFLYISCIMTGVRKIVILPFLFIYFCFAYKYRKNLFKIIMITIITIAAGLWVINLAMKFSTSFAVRITQFLNSFNGSGTTELSYGMRSDLMSAAWQCFKENPIIGYGIEQFKVYSILHGGKNLYSHCNWLEILACTGILGFLIYYGNQLKLIISGLKYKSRYMIFMVGFTLTMFCSDIFQVSYYYEPFILIFASISSLGIRRLQK